MHRGHIQKVPFRATQHNVLQLSSDDANTKLSFAHVLQFFDGRNTRGGFDIKIGHVAIENE